MPRPVDQSRDEGVTYASSPQTGLAETGRLAFATSTNPSLRNPANKLWAKTTQREAFVKHLSNWAADHDSSNHFHGSIGLHPQGTFPGEVMELGKSVNCILTDTSFMETTKTIVVRLYKSQRQRVDGQASKRSGRNDSFECSSAASWSSRNDHGNYHERVRMRRNRSTATYQLVIRSGSGWVPARQYFDKHCLAHRARSDARAGSPRPACTSPAANLQRSLWASLAATNLSGTSLNQNAEATAAFKQTDQKSLLPTHSRYAGTFPTAKDTVTISPLFHPFLRLPQELQHQILYQAVGYTRSISLTRTAYVSDDPLSSKPPITISKLFRISKTLNEQMVAHIFRSTNFHFGVTGFTKFLWQLGPTNRSDLQHLTFHFGKASLLHCIRWLAPDPIYELFKPPVATTPTSLTYYWRCQLQDLMRELKLLTLTIDTTNVPAADVPMLVRILTTAIGSVEHVWVINEHVRTEVLIDGFPQNTITRATHMPEVKWREMSLKYHTSYRHQRWHMRPVWAIPDVDLRPLLNMWMDKERAFFDS